MRKVGFTAFDRALKTAEAATAKPGEAVPPSEVDETVPPPEVDEAVPLPKSGADKKKPKSRGAGKKKAPPAAEAKAEVIENAGDGGDVSEAQPEPGDAVGDGA